MALVVGGKRDRDFFATAFAADELWDKVGLQRALLAIEPAYQFVEIKSDIPLALRQKACRCMPAS